MNNNNFNFDSHLTIDQLRDALIKRWGGECATRNLYGVPAQPEDFTVDRMEIRDEYGLLIISDNFPYVPRCRLSFRTLVRNDIPVYWELSESEYDTMKRQFFGIPTN